jgi:hypothetical protein
VNGPVDVTQDRMCLCCNRRESKIAHVRVGREGKVIANRTRALMSWYQVAS